MTVCSRRIRFLSKGGSSNILASTLVTTFSEDIRVDLPFAAKVHERLKKFIDSQLDKKTAFISVAWTAVGFQP